MSTTKIKRAIGRASGDQRGQSLIEMAVVTGLLLLILIGVADFGRAFNNYIIITNASREGARYGSRFPYETNDIINATIAEAEGSGITLEPSNVTIQCLDGASPLGECPGPEHDNTLTDYSIRVTVEYTFDTLIAGIIGFDTLTLRGSTEMVIFGPDTDSQS